MYQETAARPVAQLRSAEQASIPKKVGSVEQAFARLTACDDQLIGALDELSDRLQVVLRSDPPTAGEVSQDAIRKATCPMENEVNVHIGRVQLAAERISNILQRLEL